MKINAKPHNRKKFSWLMVKVERKLTRDYKIGVQRLIAGWQGVGNDQTLLSDHLSSLSFYISIIDSYSIAYSMQHISRE